MYKKRDINKRLKALKASELFKSGYDYATNYKGVRIPGIKVTRPGGEIPDVSIIKIARRISEIDNTDPNYIKKVLKGKEKPQRLGGLERLATPAIIILSIGLVSLILIQQNITGFAIAQNVSNTTSLVGIFICVIGIIGLLFYKFKKK